MEKKKLKRGYIVRTTVTTMMRMMIDWERLRACNISCPIDGWRRRSVKASPPPQRESTLKLEASGSLIGQFCGDFSANYPARPKIDRRSTRSGDPETRPAVTLTKISEKTQPPPASRRRKINRTPGHQIFTGRKDTHTYTHTRTHRRDRSRLISDGPSRRREGWRRRRRLEREKNRRLLRREMRCRRDAQTLTCFVYYVVT
jgi:hypothetical protein